MTLNGQGRSGTEPSLYRVAALLRMVRHQLEGDFGNVWVEGDISDLARPRSGHLYFALRDDKEDATLRAVMWASDARRLSFSPSEGQRVRARGTLTLYAARGTFQMRVARLVEGGDGDLHRKFEQVRARLEAQGLLDETRKRPLPPTPQKIAVVTSRDGAALRDILKVLNDRVPLSVVVVHTAVQGESAPGEIVAALRRVAKLSDVEVVIAGRGGGAADELACWNDEAVALAIAEHPVPVISAVGHETDVTIADLVADRRAATPTEAAVLVAPDLAVAQRTLDQARRQLLRSMPRRLTMERAGFRALSARLPDGWRLLDGPRQRADEMLRRLEETLKVHIARCRKQQQQGELRLARLHPRARVQQRRAAWSALALRMHQWGRLDPERRRNQLGRLAASLDTLSPLHVLSRGYAVARTPLGKVVTGVDQVQTGESLALYLRRGSLDCQVTGTRESDEASSAERFE